MRVPDHEPIRRRLGELGAVPADRVLEVNTFFDTEQRDLLAGDRGLRLRRETSAVSGEARYRLAYKGPRQSGPLKAREELELGVDNPQHMELLLARLGYTPRLRFEKRRETHRLDDCEIALDELPRLGLFVEIEGRTEKSVMALREKLGLSESPLLVSSYVQMLSSHLRDRSSDEHEVRFAESGVATD